MDESPKPKSSWWQTLPGVLTAAAAAVTAIAGLIGGLSQAGVLRGGNAKPTAAPTEQVAVVKPTPAATEQAGDVKPTPVAKVQLCSDRAGYPTGRWGIVDKNNSSPDLSTFVNFTRPTGGTWINGSFESYPAPSPGAEVVLKLRVDAGNYLSTNNLVVSSDGCRMDGTYLDSQGRKGEASYFYDFK